jgi:protein-disulfide isomerase
MDTEIKSTQTQEDLPAPETPALEILTPEFPAAPAPRRSLRWLYWLPVAFAAGMIASYFAFAYPLQGKLKSAESQIAVLQQGANDSQQAAAADAQAVKRYDIPTEGFPSRGPADAPIVIVEFSDFECPYCIKWFSETWPQIQSKYGDKVRLVYRDFPLYGVHSSAEPSALAANCANEQGKFWQYHDALFSGKYALSRASFEAIAADLGMDPTKFNACLDTQKFKTSIDSDVQFASNLGIQSTPTFFINGLALVGAQPFSVFDKVITMELNGEIPKE